MVDHQDLVKENIGSSPEGRAVPPLFSTSLLLHLIINQSRSRERERERETGDTSEPILLPEQSLPVGNGLVGVALVTAWREPCSEQLLS